METPADDLHIFSLPDEVLCLVFSYLTLNDLKELRLACNRFNDAILKSSTFKNLSQICVSPKNLADVAESIKRKSRLNFRNVEFSNVHDCSEVSFIMAAISMDVHQLILSDARIYQTLASVKLTHLHRIKVADFDYEERSNWIPNAGKNLKSLDLQSTHSSLQDHFLEELNKSRPGKIKSLSVGLSNETLLISVLKLNAKSLNDLSILGSSAIRLQKEWAEIFQNMISLRSLKLCDTQSCDEWIYEILAALPETAPLKCIAINGECEMLDKILKLVGKKFQNSLEDADFSECPDITRNGLEELLRVAHSLKKLDISYCDINLESFTFDSKPMIQELNLSGLDELTENCICYLAEKLTNLVFLNLSNSISGTTNKSLAYIFRYQTRLRTLILADCHQITDKGLMGLGEIEWTLPMPIARLKFLKTLDLSGINCLTDEPFFESIAFKELREFKMCESDQITNHSIVSLTVNCPAIERLYLPNCPQLTVEALDIIATNLKRLRNFDIKTSNIFTSEVIDKFYQKNSVITQTYPVLKYT